MSWQPRVVGPLAQRGAVLAVSALIALTTVVGPWAAAPVAAVSGINVQLPLGHEISGHVYGPGNVPIAGVDVNPEGTVAFVSGTTTAADGSFVIHGVVDDTYQIQFFPPDGSDLLPRWYGAPTSSQDSTGAVNVVVSGANVTGIDETLEAGVAISGTFIGDGTDPVGGIQVIAQGSAGVGSAQTAADGSYSISGLFPGTYALSTYASATVYQPGAVVSGSIVEAPAEGSPIDVSAGSVSGVNVTLAVGAVISGHVTGGDAPIEVVADEDAGGFNSTSANVSTSGDYAITGLWPNTYSILFEPVANPSKPDSSDFPYGAYANGTLVDQNSGVPVDASGGSITLASIAIPVGTALRGTITGDSLPLANAYVYVCDPSLGCVSTDSAADGSFWIGHFETGNYTIFANAAHHVSGYYGPGGYSATSAGATIVPIAAGGPDVTGITVALPDGGVISGTITGPGSVPVAGAQMATSGGASPGTLPCRSAADGTYDCDGLPAGLTTVYVNAPLGQDELSGYYEAGAPGNYTSDFSQATQVNVTFGIDVTPPTVVSRSPDRNATHVARDAVVSVQFSEDVKGAGSKNFQLWDLHRNKLVPATWSYDSVAHVARLSPKSLLATGQTYSVVLTNGITDIAGNKLKASTWTFTTTTDDTPPRIVARTPKPGAKGVAGLTPISVQFSEQVRGANSSTFRVIERSTGQVVVGTITYDAPSRTATFSDTFGLNPHDVYVVALSAGIVDLAGNPLAPTTWSFTTGT